MNPEPFTRIPVGNANFIIGFAALHALDHAPTWEEAVKIQRQLQEAENLTLQARAVREGTRYDANRVPRVKIFQRVPDMWECVAAE